MFDAFVEGVGLALRLDTMLYMSAGLFLGMFVGALPGFTTLMAMAILLPISFFLDPLLGIPFLIGVYKGGIYGGSVPAILVSMPGTGAAVATTFDGPALTKKGQGRKALEIALFSSVSGDLTSDIITIALIGPIAAVALLLGPPELAAILFLALIVISATSSGVFVKGLLMLVVGLFLGMIGQDPIGALSRFSFGFAEIEAGIPLLPMLIGVFALPEIF
ncbi:MAG: tripartite tricarboxylate transporter permease, partial [Hyphomicrobiaceae bacterium]